MTTRHQRPTTSRLSPGSITVVTENLARIARDAHAVDRAWVTTRAIAPGDRQALVRFFHELSPQSRYRRFLSIKSQLTPRELDWLTEVDHVAHEAMVAVDVRDEQIVGVCRYVRDKARPGFAEFAIAVLDEWHRLGVGTQLAGQIVKRARDNGMTAVSAVTLPYNPPVHALLENLGFRRVGRRVGEYELNWELALTPPRAGPGGKG
jgi:RimJ/RimL family protein N-acetyltransferase